MLSLFAMPLIGILSDRTRTRSGLVRREPWIIAGSLLSKVSVHFPFVPPSEPSVVRYAAWCILLFLVTPLVVFYRGGARVTPDCADVCASAG